MTVCEQVAVAVRMQPVVSKDWLVRLCVHNG